MAMAMVVDGGDGVDDGDCGNCDDGDGDGDDVMVIRLMRAWGW